MTKTYIIVDDDPAFVLFLKKKLDHFEMLKCVGTYGDTLSAASGITKHKPDILFLDMNIDTLNGLEILSVLDKQPKTIIISASTDYVETAFTFKVYDYIKKPIPSLERLQTAIEKVL